MGKRELREAAFMREGPFIWSAGRIWRSSVGGVTTAAFKSELPALLRLLSRVQQAKGRRARKRG